MMAVTGRAMTRRNPMLITFDLKRRLDKEFFARLVSQLTSASGPTLRAARSGQDHGPAARPEVVFGAGLAGYGPMRMAVLQNVEHSHR